MKRLIITADDFGVFPSINEGVKEVIRLKKLNSVAVLSNHSDSVRNTKALIEEFPGVEIGCHLTITSGTPVTDVQGPFVHGKYFRSFDALKITSIEKNSDALEKELKAQVNVLQDSGIEVKHLSCHHGTLCFTRKLFDVYAKVAKELKLPVRSVNIEPEGKDNLYRKILQLILADNIPISKLSEIRKFGREILSYKEDNYPGLSSPSILESRHYGPPPMVEVMDIRLRELAERKNRELTEFFEEWISGDKPSAELMLHLIKDDIYLYEQDDDIDYPGVNRKYFDSRNVEMHSLMKFPLSDYLDRVKLIPWKEL